VEGGAAGCQDLGEHQLGRVCGCRLQGDLRALHVQGWRRVGGENGMGLNGC
jgi:hypothetical protein